MAAAFRGLAVWRAAKAASRTFSSARLSCRMQRVVLNPPLASRTVYRSCLGQRYLSSNTLSGDATAGPGSTSPLVSESDPTHQQETEATTVTSDDESPSESESDSDSDTTSDLEDRSVVLEAAMAHVASLSWTPAALEEGAKDAGVHVMEDMFPRGGGELVDHFEIQSNSELVDFMKQKVEEEGVKGAELLEEAMEHRLRMIIPYIHNWPQAMALKAFPINVPTALENLALMVDDMWYYAGDRSTDFSWYTKRGLLATIYSSAVFLVQDTSADFKETWQFLHRRMEDAKTFGKASKELQGLVSGSVETLSAGFNTALSALERMRSR